MQIKSFLLCALCCAAPLMAQSNGGYKISQKIPVSGEGGWDFITIDEGGNRLFVSHGTQVNVINSITGAELGIIPNTNGVHGIALAGDLNKGYTSNGKDSSVTVFDLKTLKVLGKVQVTGQNPDAILYDSFSQQIFVFNGKSKNATVINAKSDQVVGSIALEGKPEVPVIDGLGHLYINIEDKSLIQTIDTKTLKVSKTWSIAPGSEPSGLAIDTQNQILFSVCDNKLMIILDAKTGKVLSSLPIGDRVDGVAFDPQLKRAYSSNGEGNLTVVQEVNANEFKVIASIPTQKSARTIAVNTLTHHIYLPAAEFGETPSLSPTNPKPRPQIKPGSFVVLDLTPSI